MNGNSEDSHIDFCITEAVKKREYEQIPAEGRQAGKNIMGHVLTEISRLQERYAALALINNFIDS
jgi:hypothetical protein